MQGHFWLGVGTAVFVSVIATFFVSRHLQRKHERLWRNYCARDTSLSARVAWVRAAGSSLLDPARITMIALFLFVLNLSGAILAPLLSLFATTNHSYVIYQLLSTVLVSGLGVFLCIRAWVVTLEVYSRKAAGNTNNRHHVRYFAGIVVLYVLNAAVVQIG